MKDAYGRARQPVVAVGQDSICVDRHLLNAAELEVNPRCVGLSIVIEALASAEAGGRSNVVPIGKQRESGVWGEVGLCQTIEKYGAPAAIRTRDL